MSLFTERYETQRILSERTGFSIGIVNRALKRLKAAGCLNEDMELTARAREMLRAGAPRAAVILAAGYGMRMTPVSMELPKALLRVKGEVLIERIIRQLHEAGIYDISVVVGFMKERFEYLIDEFGVSLIVNSLYSVRNNLYSLSLAAARIGNTYIIPADIRAERSPFSKAEAYSWYMISEAPDRDSSVRLTRGQELEETDGRDGSGNRMIGIAYLEGGTADRVRARVEAMAEDPRFDDCFWEEALYPPRADHRRPRRMELWGKLVDEEAVIEINTCEQLRELDAAAEALRSRAFSTLAGIFHVPPEEIRDIDVLKKGMTNRSFLFSCGGVKYIMRIPGKGTEKLIDREQEAAVYRAISGRGLCDDPVYIDARTGYKVTRYLPSVRSCDPHSEEDQRKAMAILRRLHEMKLSVDHSFDLFAQMERYEALWGGEASVFRDYERTKRQVLSLKDYIASCRPEYVLSHIDAIPDNFLFYADEAGEERVQLTDWEYAGMQDPYVDIAMFCIYSAYSREESDHLMELYFGGDCGPAIRARIYCYMAAGGLLWSNWCEYKRSLGVEFGAYSLMQYRYAKEFYRHAARLIQG